MTIATNYSNSTGPQCLNCGMCVQSPGEPAKAGGVTINYPALMFSPAASRAKTLVSLVRAQVLTGTEADCGLNSSDSLANYDPVSCSWRTCQLSLFEAQPPLLPRLPKWGTWGHGVLYQQPTPEPATDGSDGGVSRGWMTPKASDAMMGQTARTSGRPKEMSTHLQCQVNCEEEAGMWPTPTVDDHKQGMRDSGEYYSLTREAREWATPNASDATGTHGGRQTRSLRTDTHQERGHLNPAWVEQMQGYPLGWTELED